MLRVRDVTNDVQLIHGALQKEGLLDGNSFVMSGPSLTFTASAPKSTTRGNSLLASNTKKGCGLPSVAPVPVPATAGPSNTIHDQIRSLRRGGAPTSAVAVEGVVPNANTKIPLASGNSSSELVKMTEDFPPLDSSLAETLWPRRDLLLTAHESFGIQFEPLANRLASTVVSNMMRLLDMPSPSQPSTPPPSPSTTATNQNNAKEANNVVDSDLETKGNSFNPPKVDSEIQPSCSSSSPSKRQGEERKSSEEEERKTDTKTEKPTGEATNNDANSKSASGKNESQIRAQSATTDIPSTVTAAPLISAKKKSRSSQHGSPIKYIEACLRAGRTAALLLEYLIDTLSNTARSDPLFYCEGLPWKCIIEAVSSFQRWFAVGLFVPSSFSLSHIGGFTAAVGADKTANGMKGGANASPTLANSESLLLPPPLVLGAGSRAALAKATPQEFARCQLLAKGLLSRVWVILAAAGIVDPCMAASFLVGNSNFSQEDEGEAPAASIPEAGEADSSPTTDVTIDKEHKIAVSPLFLSSTDVSLRAAFLSAVNRTLALTLAEPRASDKALSLAVSIAERCLLKVGPFRLWTGNEKTVLPHGWLSSLTHLVTPTNALSRLVAAHPDFKAALNELVSKRLADSKAHEASVVDVAVLSLVDHGAYMAILEQLSAVETEDLKTSSFFQGLFVPLLSSGTFSSSASPSVHHLRLLLSSGLLSIVCGGGSDPTEAVGLAATVKSPSVLLPVPTEAMREMKRRVDALVRGMASPCVPTSPSLSLWLLDAILNGYMLCSTLSKKAKEKEGVASGGDENEGKKSNNEKMGASVLSLGDLVVLSNSLPPAAAVAMSIVHYPPLLLALKTNVTVSSQVTAALSGYASSIWRIGCISQKENKAKQLLIAASGEPPRTAEENSIRRLADVLLRIGVPLLRTALEVVAFSGGGNDNEEDTHFDEHSEEARAPTTEYSPPMTSSSPPAERLVFECLSAISHLSALPANMLMKEKSNVMEGFIKIIVSKAMLMATNLRSTSRNPPPPPPATLLLGWVERTMEELSEMRSNSTSFARLLKSNNENTNDKQQQPQQQGAPVPLADFLLASRVATVLVVLTQRPLVLGATSAAILRLWGPTAVSAITEYLPLVPETTLSEYLGPRAHDALTAPIKFAVPVAPLMMPTYVALFAPPRPSIGSNGKKNPTTTTAATIISGKAAADADLGSTNNTAVSNGGTAEVDALSSSLRSSSNAYGPLPLSLLRYFAVHVRPTIQSLEKCHAGSLSAIIGGCEETKNYILASLRGSDGRETLAAAESFTVLKGELLLVQRLYENISYIIEARSNKNLIGDANRRGPQSPSPSSSSTSSAFLLNQRALEDLNDRLPIYMNALLFLLNVSDPRTVTRVCASVELIIIHELRGRQREQEFWMRQAENVIASSTQESSKLGLVQWWMRLGELLRKSAFVSKL